METSNVGTQMKAAPAAASVAAPLMADASYAKVIVRDGKITGVDLPFKDVFWLTFKVGISLIPVGILIGIIYTIIFSVFSGMMIGLG
ncbi:hypothetical protein [Maridesulfovibrio sp. FT414]|uniref:hypothetical protein n=1 Tax=Maridesulfovibrio sp. FT414 TaxID=2979469 RepID=UPI003D809548